MTNQVNAEAMKLAPDALIELYILDTTVIGSPSIEYFHAGTSETRWPIVFQGITYQPFPIEITGFERSGQGVVPKPTATVSNIGGLISATALQYDDLFGLTLPGRQILQNSCPWKYKGAECSWVPVPGKYFDVNDVSQATVGGDVCGKRLTSCSLRFGAAPLPFGAFP